MEHGRELRHGVRSGAMAKFADGRKGVPGSVPPAGTTGVSPVTLACIRPVADPEAARSALAGFARLLRCICIAHRSALSLRWRHELDLLEFLHGQRRVVAEL